MPKSPKTPRKPSNNACLSLFPSSQVKPVKNVKTKNGKPSTAKTSYPQFRFLALKGMAKFWNNTSTSTEKAWRRQEEKWILGGSVKRKMTHMKTKMKMTMTIWIWTIMIGTDEKAPFSDFGTLSINMICSAFISSHLSEWILLANLSKSWKQFPHSIKIIETIKYVCGKKW